MSRGIRYRSSTDGHASNYCGHGHSLSRTAAVATGINGYSYGPGGHGLVNGGHGRATNDPTIAPAAATLPKPNESSFGCGGGRKSNSQSLKFRLSASNNGSMNQNKSKYQKIRRNCLENGLLFEDDDFVAGSRILFNQKKPIVHPIVWLRPHEICHRPKFQRDRNTHEDFAIESGEFGDQFLLSALATLTLTPKLLDRVVPRDQGFDSEHRYCGIFRFRFWYFGEWKEIVIDDRLPTYRGKLINMRSSNSNHFWASLLEKAYAKLYGCYGNLIDGGSIGRALQDLTGGIVQYFMLTPQERYLTFQVLQSAVPRSSLLVASIISAKDTKRFLRLRNGLVTQHAYCVTGLARVRGNGGEVTLIRLRNPWGFGEWTGPWSDRSWEWDGLSARDKELLSNRTSPDSYGGSNGFWMSFDDFIKYFTQLDLLHIGPDDWMLESALHSKQPWRAVLARRRWRDGYNAGGGHDYRDLTTLNPQFHIQIPRTTTASTTNSKCHVVVSLVQHYEPAAIKQTLFAIGFTIYEVPHSLGRLSPAFIADKKPLDITTYTESREVVTFFTLPPGDYIILPQTNLPHLDTKFILRIFTDEPSNIWEINDENLVQNIPDEFIKALTKSNNELVKLLAKYPREIDAKQLQKILRACKTRSAIGNTKPSFELCQALIMLRDMQISGKIEASDVSLLVHLLHYWRHSFRKFEKCCGCAKTSSYNTRSVLWEVGVTVSNKVLECILLRFAHNRSISLENFFLAMIRIYLAHDRYRHLDHKLKSNPLSLEEIILMTLYS